MALKAKTIGEAIVEIMEQTNSPRTGRPPMSRVELGNLIGVTPSNLSRITNPDVRQRPSDELLRSLADAFPHLTTFEELMRLREQSPEPAPRKPKRERAAAGKAKAKAKAAETPKGEVARPAEEKAPAPAATHATPTAPERPRATVPTHTTRAARAVALPGGVADVPSSRRSIATPAGHRPAPRPASFHQPSAPAAPGEAAPEHAPLAAVPQVPASPDAEPAAPVAAQPHPANGKTRSLRPASLVAAHLATIGLFARTLENDGGGVVASPATRFAVAASLALGELERVAGPDAFSADTQAAAAALLNDLWRVAARTRHGDQPEIRTIEIDEAERQRLEAFIAAARDRRDAFRRLSAELPAILFPDGYTESDTDELRGILLRGLTLGAKR